MAAAFAGLVAVLAAQAAASPASSSSSQDLVLRALPNNPSGNYTPIAVDCPTDKPTARAASALSSQETKWLALRRKATRDPLVTFLSGANITGFNASSYIAAADEANVPNIGLAVSGGGYRALMNGAGFLAAADSRTPDLPAAGTNGSIAGLLQAATYLAGLSGGGWLVGSMFANNFSTVVAMRDGYDGSDLWRFDNSIFSGPSSDAQDNGNTTAKSAVLRRRAEELAAAELDGLDDSTLNTTERLAIISTAKYWIHVADQVSEKEDAGFDVSITDYWGRALSYQLINAPQGGPSYTFSSIADSDDFAAGNTPMPILVADSRAPNTTAIYLNSTVFEFNPYEMGSWDPTTYGFVPTEYLGSNFSNGAVVESAANDSHCVRGLDQFGYVMGTSSTLFNQFLLANLSAETSLPSWVLSLVNDTLERLGKDNNDIAQWVPNPFLNYHPETNAFANQTQLTLIDGGEDLQNIPLHPLLQPLRAVDVIVAVDSSADTDSTWPNGTALRASYERSTSSALANGTLFPAVPDAFTFINLGLNKRPTFFGCDATNFTLTGSQTVPPLVVYLPNAPYSALSNVTTFTDSYTLTLRNDIITNGLNAATQGNGTVNSDWQTCLACAVLSRSFYRSNTTVPTTCTDCFSKYCWNGTINSTDTGLYEPGFIIADLAASDSAAPALAPAALWRSAVVVASATAALLVLL